MDLVGGAQQLRNASLEIFLALVNQYVLERLGNFIDVRVA